MKEAIGTLIEHKNVLQVAGDIMSSTGLVR